MCNGFYDLHLSTNELKLEDQVMTLIPLVCKFSKFINALRTKVSLFGRI